MAVEGYESEGGNIYDEPGPGRKSVAATGKGEQQCAPHRHRLARAHQLLPPPPPRAPFA